MATVVSAATRANFTRLDKDLENHQFASRANKQDSRKRIIPSEYFSNKKNRKLLADIVGQIRELPLQKAISDLIVSFFYQRKIIYIDHGTVQTGYEHVSAFLKSFTYSLDLLDITLPEDERDPIGLIYQQLLSEGQKNKKGSYFTPKWLVDDLLEVRYDRSCRFCDPCCGTGGFLIEALDRFDPSCIFGYDSDPLAVMIAKANMFVRKPDADFNRTILNRDFLKEDDLGFDLVVTNPPWGNIRKNSSPPSSPHIKSKEMFSYFLEHSLNSLKQGGEVRFLLPVSIMNVKAHADIRKMIIEDCRLTLIKEYGKCFKGVLTDVIAMEIVKEKPEGDYEYRVMTEDGRSFRCSSVHAKDDPDHKIMPLDAIDRSIISKIKAKARLDLKDAQFALGIVTGDNARMVKNEPGEGLSPIITGKDINRYHLNEPSHYIRYERGRFQQVCPEWFFTADRKYLYRFISKKLVFAVDQGHHLALNSANIVVVPDDYPLNRHALLGLLDSAVINFYFIRTVGQLKVLKSDIRDLPLPLLPEDLQKKLSAIVEEAVEKKDQTACVKVDDILFAYYGLTQEEIARIKSVAM